MTKVEAYWGHNYHFHVRIACPAGETSCQPQAPVPPGDGLRQVARLVVYGRGVASSVESQRQAESRRSRSRNCRPNAEQVVLEK